MPIAITDIIHTRAAPFVRRVSGRFSTPMTTPFNWIGIVEWLLLALLAIQIARIVWAVVTPVDSYGNWSGRQAVIPDAAARQALFTRFDAFFRTADTGPNNSPVVTSLALVVYGIRVNEGSGQGSAIIATPDGIQSSFAVGDEILPGVTLKAVAFDHVLIDRGGAEETVFLDQSVAAPVANPDGTPSPAAPSAATGAPQVAAPAPLTAAAIKSDIGFAPRIESGRVTGLVLSPKGPAFQAAGLQPGDIVVQVNGRPITSASDLQVLQGQIQPGARISLMVERGATTVPLALILQGQ